MITDIFGTAYSRPVRWSYACEIWSEVQKKLAAEAPEVESEIARIQAQLQKTLATLSRYREESVWR